jgi:hypothetical protein
MRSLGGTNIFIFQTQFVVFKFMDIISPIICMLKGVLNLIKNSNQLLFLLIFFVFLTSCNQAGAGEKYLPYMAP